jgi:hypothetical protein
MCSRPAISFLLITLQAKYSPVFKSKYVVSRVHMKRKDGEGEP